MIDQLELSELKRDWIDESALHFECFMERDQKFSADDLHRWLDAPPHDGWWGCLMSKLRCSGKIREVGRVRSTRPERNGAKISLWEVV